MGRAGIEPATVDVMRWLRTRRAMVALVPKRRLHWRHRLRLVVLRDDPNRRCAERRSCGPSAPISR